MGGWRVAMWRRILRRWPAVAALIIRAMQIRFTKMQGAGNDFVVLDETQGRLGLTPAQYRFLADRHFGVGADQILTVRPSPGPGIDFEYVIHNADGGEVGQCGNGARCFARYVRDKGLSDKDTLRVQTLSGLIAPQLLPDGRVTVDMGHPVWNAARVRAWRGRNPGVRHGRLRRRVGRYPPGPARPRGACRHPWRPPHHCLERCRHRFRFHDRPRHHGV